MHVSGLSGARFCLLLFLATGYAQQVQGEVFRVAAPGPVAPFLEKAAAGDTILLAPGEYREILLIESPVYLKGEGFPHIRGSYQGHVVQITAPGTVIDGLWIGESGTRLIEDLAGVRIEADSVTVRNCRIDQSLHGIYVKGGSSTTISDNRIEGRLDLIEADRGNGIHLWNSRHNRLFGNEIFNVRDGIYFSFADSTEVYENHIHQVRYGLHYMYSNDNVFTENLFEENVAGAALMYSQRIYFYRNIFARCRGFRAYGILYQSMEYTVAEGNLIIDNSRGLFFNNSDHNRVLNNDVVDNDIAIQINGSCDGNRLAENNFIGNLSNLLSNASRSQTEWSKDGRGNYWSDYRGYDLNGDGIGDVPHKIQNVFQIVETKIPEVRFYLFSPAAEILEIAERALPILSLGSEKDPDPLFRPSSNSTVPWKRLDQLKRNGNFTAALWFLLSSVSPVIALVYFSRRRRAPEGT
jgi:nitrous oxidase accessory protein